MTQISDFRVIDIKFIAPEEEAEEILETTKEYADSEIGLYSLEAKAVKMTEPEVAKYNLKGDYSRIELSIVVWEGYADEDLEEARKWIQEQPEISESDQVELNAREMQPDEYEAFQACAPEYFEEK